MISLGPGPAPAARVILLGDSVTAAEGVRPEQGYPALVQASLPGVRLQVQGRSGWSTESCLRRWKEVAASLPPISPTPTITLVLVQFGANDLRVFGHSERTVRETAGRIRQVCDRIRAHYGGPGTTGEKVGAALVVPPMIFPDELTLRLREAGFGPETPRFLRLLRDAYHDAAARDGFGLIDLSDVLRPGETLDGAHPMPAGHAAIARQVAADIPALLKRVHGVLA